jgi:hypothetical protein
MEGTITVYNSISQLGKAKQVAREIMITVTLIIAQQG